MCLLFSCKGNIQKPGDQQHTFVPNDTTTARTEYIKEPGPWGGVFVTTVEYYNNGNMKSSVRRLTNVLYGKTKTNSQGKEKIIAENPVGGMKDGDAYYYYYDGSPKEYCYFLSSEYLFYQVNYGQDGIILSETGSKEPVTSFNKNSKSYITGDTLFLEFLFAKPPHLIPILYHFTTDSASNITVKDAIASKEGHYVYANVLRKAGEHNYHFDLQFVSKEDSSLVDFPTDLQVIVGGSVSK